MSLGVGARLGHYTVTAKLGEGGMGEVWEATDTTLNRQVALKILPEAFAADPDRLARFQREAQVLASLNHPGIAAIYGIEEAEGTRALVLELVEGPTLADRIAHGPIPLDEALPIAKQIAEALEAAHEAGVIHRDLKPANVKVRADGTVKVLDFGLAKALEGDAGGDPSQSPTLTAAATKMGVIMGTAAYMSPEQASGETADTRSDVWSFGVVLFETLTGQRLFTGKTVSHVLAKVLERDLDFTALPTSTPAPLRRLLRRCLERERKRRLRDVGDALSHLEEAATTPAGDPSVAAAAAPVVQAPGWRRAMPWVAGIVVASVVTGLAVWSVTRPTPPGPRPLARFVVTTPLDGPLNRTNTYPDVAISPDGTRIVYLSGGTGTRNLYVRQVDQLDATLLRGTEPGQHPFFSPDGEWVGFQDTAINALKKVSVLGGPPVTILDLGRRLFGASWGPDDTIVFATGGEGLLRVPAVGGEPEALTTVDPEQTETAHLWPEFLPNGKAVLFTAWSGSDESSRIAMVSLETKEVTYLLPGGSHPRYAPTGHIVYAVGGSLRAVGFDAERLELTSNNPVPVLENVDTKASGAANFGFSSDGALVYVTGTGSAPVRTLVWVDRDGREEPINAPPRTYVRPRLSPDGTRVAVDIFDQEQDIWVWDFARQTFTRLTFDPAPDGYPVWTPDGQRLIFASLREGAWNLYWRAADGTGAAERLTEDQNDLAPYAVSPDGTRLVLGLGGNLADVGMLSLEGDHRVEPLLATTFVEGNADISPDGRWIAYDSDETGRGEVYVRPFPDVEGGRWQISTAGGREPIWARSGRELFYYTPGGVMSVPLQSGPSLTFGNASVVVEGGYVSGPPGRQYDASPDGERFLMIKAGGDETSTSGQIIVVQNWLDELAQRVPVP